MPVSTEKKNWPVIELLIACAAAFFAYTHYFIQDDAYIAFVYAGHFAHGDGLVWYPHSTEFGYTSFLYTLWIGGGIALGLDPEYVSAATNLLAFAASLWLSYRLTQRLSGSRLAAQCTALALATHPSFTAYASGGLETMVVTALLLCFYDRLLSYLESGSRNIAWQFACIAAIVLFVRLDMSLLMFPGYVLLLMRAMANPVRAGSELAAMVALPVLAVISLLTGCRIYYGYPLSNDFYLTMPNDNGMLKTGLAYLSKYANFQKWLPYLLLFITGNHLTGRLYGETSQLRFRFHIMLAGVLALWLVYVVHVGGDFMEFRLLVPVLPLLYILPFATGALCFNKAADAKLVLLLALCITANGAQAFLFRGVPENGGYRDPMIETTDGLYNWMNKPDVNWRVIGQKLHALFYTGSPDDVKIAVGPAGAIPYYSGLPAFDILGLNDRDVVNHSFPINNRPGHRFMANNGMLNRERVNLSIFHPQALCMTGGILTWVPNSVESYAYKRVETILIPLDHGCYLAVDYRLSHPRVEQLLAEKTILRYRDVKKQTRCPKWLCLK